MRTLNTYSVDEQENMIGQDMLYHCSGHSLNNKRVVLDCINDEDIPRGDFVSVIVPGSKTRSSYVIFVQPKYLTPLDNVRCDSRQSNVM